MENVTADTQPDSLPRRWRLIVLAVALALFQAVAAARTLTVPPELAAQLSLPLPLEFAAGVWWALLFTFIAVNLVQMKPQAVRWMGWALVGFIVYSFARLLLFAQADYDRERLPFLLVLTLLSVIVAALLLRRPRHGEL